MASTSETGHAKNLANFKTLITVCTGLGSSYNPAKKSIQLPQLQNSHLIAENSLKALNQLIPALTNAINEREKIYEPLKSLAARINGAVAASEVPANLPADVKTLTRKLTGRRAKPKKESLPGDEQNPAEQSESYISVSQLSFDSRLQNLEKLIELLAAQPGYAPNETELSVAGLRNLLTSMNNLNNTVLAAQTAVANGRLARNTQLYHPDTGLIKTAADVKAYIRSVFSLNSPQYAQVGKLQFRKISRN